MWFETVVPARDYQGHGLPGVSNLHYSYFIADYDRLYLFSGRELVR